MGAKDSKPNFITYEDAVKRVPDNELRRIREAFKRCAGANGASLTLESFVRDVLSDGVPFEVAEWLYQACGGTKRGIAFRDLLCGLVVLTKGSIDEKIKFLWTLYVNYQNDNGTYLYKRDFAMALHFENNSLPVTEAHRTAETLTSLFGSGEKVTYEQFRSWLLIHKQATVLSRWLLTERLHSVHDLETPTFYQSLAGVTHLEERDIIELEKCFWSLGSNTATGQLDLESVSALLCPPLPRDALPGLFLAFDENGDGHIDFKELCCGLSAACRGPNTERLKFCFKIFDVDRDGVLDKKELVDMLAVLCSVANEAHDHSSRASTPSECGPSEHTADRAVPFDPTAILHRLGRRLVPLPKGGPAKPVFQLGPTADDRIQLLQDDRSGESDLVVADTALALEEFLMWAVEDAAGVVAPFLELLVEVGHIVLGLRPQCRHQERDIVLGWLHRAVCTGYSVGQFWYLVGAEWWACWLQHGGGVCRRGGRPDDQGIADGSDTNTSSESMGSLLWRADSASLGSASSSGVSSGYGRASAHPGPIDNSKLLAANSTEVRTLTGEGGHLRRDVTLSQPRDFELVPDTLWRALALWYGGPHPLPRQVIRPPNSGVELELYPLQLRLYRHVTSHTPRTPTSGPPDRHLAYTAAFSRLATVKQVSEFLSQALGVPRDALRLWALGSTSTSTGSGSVLGSSSSAVLLDDERPTLSSLGLVSGSRLLLELRNSDLTWPEEIGQLSAAAVGGASAGGGAGGGPPGGRRDTLSSPDLPGATGLHNLGNTCYMNAALHAVWNTGPLTRYFISGLHLFEVNVNNPLGTRGALAIRYGDLCKEVWSSRLRSVAPLAVVRAVSRHAGMVTGQQQDAQELLAWLLDQLHEDLNRAGGDNASGAAATDDSGGRPDQVVASEAWAGHVARNQSIITDLFYGQLKSKVQCDACGHDSTRFDAFNMLSLPLPMECCVRAEVKVILQDGSIPVKYGARVNADGTYRELKDKLEQLCGLPADRMLLVLLSGAVVGRVLSDSAKISPATACQLYAYEIPETPRCERHLSDQCDNDTDTDTAAHNYEMGAPSPWRLSPSLVSPPRPRRVAPSLCMPALFCFKRSRSEILMSASPPSLTPPVAMTVYRSATLPRNLAELDRSESVPRSSPLSPVAGVSPATVPPRPPLGPVDGPNDRNYIIAVHRKQCRSDAYFLPWQRSYVVVFGEPVVVAVGAGMSGRQLYAQVWRQVARLLSARPATEHANHATDCDDSLGYEFPFTLRVVSSMGGRCGRCALCAWPAACTGCALPQDCRPLLRDTHTYGNGIRPHRRPSSNSQSAASEARPNGSECESPIAKAKLQRQASWRFADDYEEGCAGPRLPLECLRRAMLAIDWDPTALHLRYQPTRAKACTEHESVATCVSLASRAVDLASCLTAFTASERLDERYHCGRCKQPQPATKKLQIWRAPPILIIHLKRFQYVNNKWIKSAKVVNFPFSDFDPTPYLAAVPQETILRHAELSTKTRHSLFVDETISESDSEEETLPNATAKESKPKAKVERRRRESAPVAGRQRLESTSLVNTPVTDDNLIDYHQHHLTNDQDPFDLKYRLYAVVSHSGQLHGGHYVCYARHPSGTWLCYNDSSCRELPSQPCPPIDPTNAYLLFYERQGLEYEAYLPDTSGKQPVTTEGLDSDDSDLRKMCVLA